MRQREILLRENLQSEEDRREFFFLDLIPCVQIAGTITPYDQQDPPIHSILTKPVESTALYQKIHLIFLRTVQGKDTIGPVTYSPSYGTDILRVTGGLGKENESTTGHFFVEFEPDEREAMDFVHTYYRNNADCNGKRRWSNRFLEHVN
jgi:hypothetical protein